MQVVPAREFRRSAPAGRAPSGGELLLVTQRPIDEHGGASIRWRHLTQALPDLGWSVSVVSSETPEAEVAPSSTSGRTLPRVARTGARLAQHGLQQVGVEPAAFLPEPWWSITGRGPIARAVAAKRPDLIWVTCPPPAAMFAAANVARRTGLPLVLEFRDLWAGNRHYDLGRLRPLQDRAVRAATRIVCVTDQACERLAELHPHAADRLVVVPNGFEPQLLELRERRILAQRDPAVLVHAGSLYASRSIDGLVEALAGPRLRDRAKLLLIGDVNERSADALAAAAGRIRAEVRPPVSWEEAVDATSRADIAVVVFTPGDDTAVPGKLYEALALGVPVLALVGRDSAMERLLRDLGHDRGIAPHDDPAAIAATVERLIEQPPPPVPVEAIARFDRARIARRVAALLDGLVTR